MDIFAYHIDFLANIGMIYAVGGDTVTDLFTHRLNSDTLSFKYTRGCSERSGKEFHIYYEIILFLDGNAEFISENLHMQLKPNSLIVIPRQEYHQMIIHGNPENYHRCVLQFEETPELADLLEKGLKQVQVFEANREIQFLFDRLMQTAKEDRPHASVLLRSVLILLLDSLLTVRNVTDEEHHQNEIIRTAIQYVNKNLGKPLKLCHIANACNISESSLSHIFKKEMYCSVHKFITKKRLISAYNRIAAGETATAVAVDCGFQDYSGFYKQYKKTFGISPSQKIRTK